VAADDLRVWEPASEAEILAAIDGGVLTETHYLDVKREVGTTDGERANIARHLASLAIDGGALLIGLEEDKPRRTWISKPQPLDGLAERVEQIATYLVDPPLYTVASEIPAGSPEGSGYLFVRVPPSARAPHMVSGVYYGRGDRTRTRLSDAEVLRLHSRRESIEEVAERLLDEEAARDPQPDLAKRHCGRLYAVAQPLTGSRQLALSLTSGREMALRKILNNAEPGIPRELYAEPSPNMLSNFSHRANGVAFSDYSVTGPGRTLVARSGFEKPNEEHMLDVEFRQDGGLRLLIGRLTADWARNEDGSFAQFILDALAVAYSLRMVHWATAVAAETGYRVSWAFGVHGTGMRGLSSSQFQYELSLGRAPVFDADTYRETTTASYAEMADQPKAIAERLVGRLVRALGTDQYWSAALGATS
jgi:hypothetical protein